VRVGSLSAALAVPTLVRMLNLAWDEQAFFAHRAYSASAVNEIDDDNSARVLGDDDTSLADASAADGDAMALGGDARTVTTRGGKSMEIRTRDLVKLCVGCFTKLEFGKFDKKDRRRASVNGSSDGNHDEVNNDINDKKRKRDDDDNNDYGDDDDDDDDDNGDDGVSAAHDVDEDFVSTRDGVVGVVLKCACE
jgi:hypothetical protein